MLLERITAVIHSRELRGVILLGDVFDTHDIQDNDCLTMYSEFIRQNEERLEIHHVVGNHEMNDSKTYLPSIHALNPWHGRENVYIHDKGSVFDIDNTLVSFMPFVPNGMFKHALQEQLGEKASLVQLVFAHQEFSGCQMGASQVSKDGDENPNVQVISGHIHGEQRIGNVWYPGTPCQHTFAEAEDRYVYIIEIKDGKYEVVEQIDLELPKFKTIRTDTQNLPEHSFDDEHEYRIVIRDTPENIVLFKKSEFYRDVHKSVKFKFEVVKEKAERVENERQLSFEERFLELVEQEGLQNTYENIFEEFPKSPQPGA